MAEDMASSAERDGGQRGAWSLDSESSVIDYEAPASDKPSC
jgi:hypothetical protein